MNVNKLVKYRYQETLLMCDRRYKKLVKKIYSYAKKYYDYNEQVCKNLQDIWNLLAEYSLKQIPISEVIPDQKSFIYEAFYDIPFKKVSNKKVMFNTFIYTILIPTIVGYIIYIIFKG